MVGFKFRHTGIIGDGTILGPFSAAKPPPTRLPVRPLGHSFRVPLAYQCWSKCMGGNPSDMDYACYTVSSPRSSSQRGFTHSLILTSEPDYNQNTERHIRAYLHPSSLSLPARRPERSIQRRQTRRSQQYGGNTAANQRSCHLRKLSVHGSYWDGISDVLAFTAAEEGNPGALYWSSHVDMRTRRI